MKAKSTLYVPANIWAYAFIFIHMLAWTLVPFLVRFTLPLDSMEGFIWGQQLEWGYDKNPWLNGWLTALAIKGGGYSGWMIYLFSQLSVGLCLWATWKLAKKMLPPVLALVSILVLEGIQYYNFHAIDFNDNTLEMSLWALMILTFYHALRNQKTASWVACGALSGLSMMAKYYSVVLLLPMAIFFFMFKENYRSFRSTGFYLGIAVFLAVMAPHWVWLFQHEFVTLTYAVNRVSAPPTWWNHLSYPVWFVYDQIQAILPAVILSLVLLIGRKPLQVEKPIRLSTYDMRFLQIIGLGPLVVTLALSLLAGWKLRAGWAQPLFSLLGILLMVYVQPRVTVRRFYAFIGLITLLWGLALGGYSLALMRGKEPSSANFPGKEMAEALTAEWHQRYHRPLNFVGGSRWLTANVAFSSPDHPRVYILWSKLSSPWIDEQELNKQGAIFLWEKPEEVPGDLRQRFPRLGKVRVMELKWLRNDRLAPGRAYIAVLAPRT